MTEIGSGLLNGVTPLMREPVTTIESSGAGVGVVAVSPSWAAASSVCARAGVAIMTAIADRLAKPRFRRKRDATSFIFRSEEHTSELQSLMRSSYAVFCLKKNTKQHINIYS